MKKLFLKLSAMGTALLTTPSAYATSSTMPWATPLQTLLTDISGPTTKVIGTIAIVICGLALAMGEGGGGLKKGIQIVLGISIAATASSFAMTFFGFTGGAAF